VPRMSTIEEAHTCRI